MKAYILSREHGVVQIGDTIFAPISGVRFKTDRKSLPLTYRVYSVPDKSWQSAKLAFQLDRQKEK